MEKIGSRFFLVLEFCAGGDLKEFLDKQPGKKLDEDTARGFMCQLASGLRSLHESGVVHRDLKPHNILLSANSPTADIKIADFGFACEVRAQMQSILGSPLYMAPEVLHGKVYSSKSDLWSVGCIFYEMLTGRTPFSYVRTMDELKRTTADARPVLTMPIHVSKYCLEILNGLLQKSSNSRWDWAKFFEHPYLQPENLSRSTLELPQASPDAQQTGIRSPPPAQPKPQPKPQQIPKPAQGDASKPSNGWLQHIYVFYPHGQTTTLYLRPTMTVAEVKNSLTTMTSTPREQQLLLDYEGNELVDETPLSETIFWKQEIPMYFMRKDLFDGTLDIIPPYKFPEVPYPALEVPKEPSLATTLSPSDRVRMAYFGYSADKKEYFQCVYNNVKTRMNHCSACLKHNEYQVKVYKVLRNFSIQQGTKLKNRFSPYEAQIEDLATRSKRLEENRSAILSKLRETEWSPILLRTREKEAGKIKRNLMDGLDERNILNDFMHIHEDLNSLSSARKNAEDIITEVNKVTKSLVDTVLDTTPLARMLAANDQMISYFQQAKAKWLEYGVLLKKAEEMLKHLPSTASPEQIQQFMSVYAEMDNVFTLFVSIQSKVEDMCTKFQQDKQRCSITYINAVKTKFGTIYHYLDAFRTTISIIAKNASLLRKRCERLESISKVSHDYEKALEEVLRRASYQQQLQSEVQSQGEQLQQLREKEITKRKAFFRNYGNPFLAKLIPEFAEDNSDYLGDCSMSLEYVDPSLSEIGNHLTEATNHYKPIFSSQLLKLEEERLKTLEKENADIIELILTLKKRSEAVQNLGNVDSTLLVSRLQSELERSTKQLEEFSKDGPMEKQREEMQIRQLQQRLEEQKKQNLAISVHLANTEKEQRRPGEEGLQKTRELLKVLEGVMSFFFQLFSIFFSLCFTFLHLPFFFFRLSFLASCNFIQRNTELHNKNY
eukprot:TRINITY_DN1712_c0_g1_i1.p1 TRINITY_DN1712_c0_g1~~TRINITY_DN1712_c0_g1_i1.p1  ORF type:complete len:1024 (-),score=180.60 TRINITY_DN1712_c0_g1_i1:283-3117(-)